MADGRDPDLDDLMASLGDRPLSEISVASAKVAAIVEAAERAAEEMRIKTEERVRARIAEADRAVDLRVEAAEAEAREIIDAARAEAAGVEAEARESVRAIHERAAAAREEAERHKASMLAEASSEAARVREEAEAYAKEARQAARDDARAIVAEAQAAARGVLEDGTELSGHLSELSESLRRNAERLLNDVKLAHARLTADLDQAAPPGSSIDSAPAVSRGFASAPRPAAPRRPSGPSGPPDDDFQIPEFLPGRR
jgi:cell division septum initiation protein DivIVA